MIPAVLPDIERVTTTSELKQGFCIVMEKAQGLPLHTWFAQVTHATDTLPAVLYQFFSAGLRLFQLLRFMTCDASFHHADIKPDNIIFQNNSLRLIDYNSAT